MVEQARDLIKILTRLNEIGARVNQLGIGHDLTTTLELIAAGAVEVVTAGVPANGAEASTVIWVYDQARQEFDSESRVSAGEPQGASIDDFPRRDGLGRQAIRYRRRLSSYEPGAAHIHPLKQEVGACVLICYPLIVSDEVVGVLYVYRGDERRFDDVELLLLDNFVHLAGMAIYHGRQAGGLNKTLTRKVREMETLRRASHLISSRTNLDDTLQEILSIGLDMTAAQYGSFEFYDKTQDMLVTKALAGSKEHPADEPPLPVNESSVVGWVASNRQSLLIGNLHDSQWQAIYQPLFSDQEMVSEVAVPLIGVGDRLEGVLNIESPQPHAFTEEDLHLLEALATQAVIAMQEIRLLDAMQEIVEVLLTARVDDLLTLIVKRACELINASCGFIWLVLPGALSRHSTPSNIRPGRSLPNHSQSCQGLASAMEKNRNSARPTRFFFGTNPKARLSEELSRLSPMAKKWPSGTVNTLVLSNGPVSPSASKIWC